MALDIFINDSQKKVDKSLLLYIDDYDFLMERIEKSDNYSFLKSQLEDYYGESEVYLNELENLKLEILKFDSIFNKEYSTTVKTFITELLELIEYAISNKKTIMFVGD